MEFCITFINDYSRYGYDYFIQHKYKALEKFKEYIKEVKTQLGRKFEFFY